MRRYRIHACILMFLKPSIIAKFIARTSLVKAFRADHSIQTGFPTIIRNIDLSLIIAICFNEKKKIFFYVFHYFYKKN